MKFYSEIVKHMCNGSKFALFRLQAKNFFKRNGLTLVETHRTKHSELNYDQDLLTENSQLPCAEDLPHLNILSYPVLRAHRTEHSELPCAEDPPHWTFWATLC